MNQFFLALNDLWRRKMTSLLLLVQVVVVLILINFTLLSFFDLKDMTKEVNRLNEKQEIYSLMDITDSAQIELLLSDKTKLEELKKVYNFIFKNKDYKAFTLYSSYLTFEDDTIKDIKGIDNYEGQSTVKFVYVTDLFFQYFNMKLAEGSNLSKQDYTSDKTVIPVILGGEYKNRYHVGEVFTDINEKSYKVIGILEKGMNYIDIMSSKDFQNVDNMMLLPLNDKRLLINTDFDAIINKAYIIPREKSGMADIIKYGSKLDTYSFASKSMNEQVKFVKMDKEKWIQTQLFLSSLVAVFTLISFIISFLQFIEKNTYEFGVHFLSGATNRDIMLRIVFQILPFIVVGNIISLIISGPTISSAITLGASLVLIILVCAIPLFLINRMEINLILRWKTK